MSSELKIILHLSQRRVKLVCRKVFVRIKSAMSIKEVSNSKYSRSYRLGQRQMAVDEKRAKIIKAARELILSERALAGFSVDAVAKQSGVARMTVYNQFGGKIGLLEALFDDLAVRGQIHRLADALQKDEPLDALNNFITAFGHFWAADRMLIKRLHAMTTLDSDMAKAHATRQKGRREGLRVIVERLHEKYKLADDFQLNEVIEILHTLTGFETFDALAGATRSPEDVVPTVRKLILEVLGLDDIEGKENVT